MSTHSEPTSQTAPPSDLSEPASSAWMLTSLPGAVTAAGYLIGSNAKQYRLLVDILHDQRNVTLTGVGFDTVRQLVAERLPPESAGQLLDELSLEARLQQLVDWGTCTCWQDRAETQEDFLRNRRRYQLSDAGYQLNAAVRALEAEEGTTSTAVLLAPLTVLNRLTATIEAIQADETAVASQEFSQVQTTVHAMSDAAVQWQTRLAVALGGSPTEEKTTRVLETILTYTDMWGAGIDAWSAPIAGHVAALRQIGDDRWRGMARVRLGTNASDALLDDAIREMKADVEVLADWFSGALPQSTRLRRQIRNAVAPVLRGHRALLAIGGTVSRKADLLRLADAIESAPDDASAWSVWCAATGLYSARHVCDDAPEIAQAARVSIWDAEPVPISRRLRSQGARSLGGRAPGIVDRRAARLQARRAADAARADLDRAARRLARRSGTALSQWEPLTEAEAELFLELVADARRFGADGRPDEAHSADGRWTLRLSPLDGSAVITTPGGRLVLPDAQVEVVS